MFCGFRKERVCAEEGDDKVRCRPCRKACGRHFRRKRIKLGIKQKDLAERMWDRFGVPMNQTRISRFERDQLPAVDFEWYCEYFNRWLTSHFKRTAPLCSKCSKRLVNRCIPF